jgi:16S rRNA (cytidine1402-2'-O)-methyltransferase
MEPKDKISKQGSASSLEDFHTQRCLYLIPSTLGDSSVVRVMPSYNLEVINRLGFFVVENIRSARRFLIKCGYQKPIESIHFELLNENTDEKDIPEILLNAGNTDIGLISEAGIPAVADPGAFLVKEAMRMNIHVIPLVGPSSILLALMSSGLNGQNFAFNGYLPVRNPERNNKIRLFEKQSDIGKQTQIFIETPYRNNQLIATFIETCKPNTQLCIAANLTLPSEWIRTRTISEWRLIPPPDLNRQPAVFLIYA